MRALHVTSAAEWDSALIHLLEIVVIQGIWLPLGSQVSLWMFLQHLTNSVPTPTLSPQACYSTNSPVYHSGLHFPFIYLFFVLFSGSWRFLILSEWIIYIYILINVFFNHFKWMHNYCMDVWEFIHLPIELFDFSQLEITFG